ncbi:MAG: NifU family protein [Planctomycetota bacterium]|jgi:Fe-S cluster biogenesis protein NfuA
METVAERVRAVLRRLGPALSVDGGGVELDRVEGDTAYVKLTGACIGCPGADITLKYGLESAVTEDVPEIARVVAIETDES